MMMIHYGASTKKGEEKIFAQAFQEIMVMDNLLINHFVSSLDTGK